MLSNRPKEGSLYFRRPSGLRIRPSGGCWGRGQRSSFSLWDKVSEPGRVNQEAAVGESHPVHWTHVPGFRCPEIGSKPSSGAMR